MVNICVLALIGLPASGKTTFCKRILNTSAEHNYNFIHVCYDHIFTYSKENSEVSFKEERKKVLEKLKYIINSIKSNDQPVEHSNPLNSKDIVIFCDDNNYYSGMRYEVYRICKENYLSFGQLYFPIDLNLALKRNSIREAGNLPVDIIENMSKRIEMPSVKNIWEKNTLAIGNEFHLEQLFSFLKLCFKSTLKPNTQTEKNQPENVNFIHEIDILMRKRIKELLFNKPKNIADEAKILNERRKRILLELKEKQKTEENKDCILQRLVTDIT